MNCESVKLQIVDWLKQFKKGFVVGISGGIDSALVSTLCAETGLPTVCVSMPIHQPKSHLVRANEHIEWLKKKYNNVSSVEIDLTEVYETNKKLIETTSTVCLGEVELPFVNLRSRLRMCNLYIFANSLGYLVAGTGNKVEDYGVGFFTKYGDGGVDISPIGDLLKSQVRELATYLGVSNSIIIAKPTDGLWGDDRSDEDQIGATYDELEWAMRIFDMYSDAIPINELDERKLKVLKIYIDRHINSKHKMNMPPICKVVK